MTAISVKQFGGMIPRSPDHLLPDNGAALAKDCDFSRGQLGPLRGGLLASPLGFNHPGPNPIRSMYTLEGIFWYTWDSELTAYKSPVIGEIYNRIYYIEADVMRVAISPEVIPQHVGGPPSQWWAAGVPTPTVAPVLELIERYNPPVLADYPAATIEIKAWYTDGTGINHDPVVVPHTVLPGDSSPRPSYTEIYPFRRYAFKPPLPPVPTPPAEGEEDEDTPVTVVYTLCVQITASEGTKRLFQMNTVTDAVAASRSAALPGGITMTLEKTPTGEYFIVLEWGVIETRAYTFTEVNTWDEESGPAPAALISPTYLQDVKVTVTHPDFGTYRPRKQTNIYRTYGGPQYIKAGFFDAGNVFTESARTVQSGTGTALLALSWVPPVTSMSGLILCPNGWFAAFKGNMLYMSEPYRPHTWPYSMTFAKSIVGICVGSQSIVVTTSEATYIVTGPHPASVTSMVLPTPVGGISQKGMCVIEGGVVFLSHDGLVIVEGSQATLEASQRYFTREVWRDLFGDVLSNMALGFHDGCVVGVSTTQAKGFILELDEAAGAMTRYDYKHTAMMRLPVLDTLYYADDTKKIYEFRKGNYLPAVWNSKQFLSPSYNKFGIGFARMSGTGSIVITVYADDTHVHTQSLNPADRTKYFRLPAQYGSLKWQLRVAMIGDCKLEDMAFAHTVEELKSV